MTIIADFPFDSNVIVILVAVIFAAVKAFFERGKTTEKELEFPDDGELHEQYEAELQRQREAMEIPVPVVQKIQEFRPPPLPGGIPPAQKAIKPKLSAAEKKALENLRLNSLRHRKRPSHHSTRSRVHRHLASPTAAREALLLAEILGPPTAFKEER